MTGSQCQFRFEWSSRQDSVSIRQLQDSFCHARTPPSSSTTRTNASQLRLPWGSIAIYHAQEHSPLRMVALASIDDHFWDFDYSFPQTRQQAQMKCPNPSSTATISVVATIALGFDHHNQTRSSIRFDWNGRIGVDEFDHGQGVARPSLSLSDERHERRDGLTERRAM